MSLDVYLIAEEPIITNGTGIFVRNNGSTREITVKEWNEKNPDRIISEEDYPEQNYLTTAVYTANITHNLNTMAEKAGIYGILWEPEENEITKAKQLIVPLLRGMIKLQEDPEHFKTLEPDNGWGTYDQLVNFIMDYLKACLQYPEAEVEVSR